MKVELLLAPDDFGVLTHFGDDVFASQRFDHLIFFQQDPRRLVKIENLRIFMLVIGKAIFVEFSIKLVKIREHVSFRKVGELQRLVDLKDKLCTILLYEALLDVTVLSH